MLGPVLYRASNKLMIMVPSNGKIDESTGLDFQAGINEDASVDLIGAIPFLPAENLCHRFTY